MLSATWIAAATSGFTVSAFSGQTENAGNTFSAAASFSSAPEFVRQLGTASCGGASSAIAVPAGGVPAGNTVVVVVVLRDTVPTGAVSVTDSRGNTYATDVDFTSSTIRKLVFSGRAVTTLAAGDTITVTHPDLGAEAVAALEFTGIQEPRVDASGANGGLSAAPAVTATTTHPDDLLLGTAGNEGNRTYTEATAWTTVADFSTNCGGGTGRLTLHAAYRVVTNAAAWTYSPSLSANDRWAAGMVAYRG